MEIYDSPTGFGSCTVTPLLCVSVWSFLGDVLVSVEILFFIYVRFIFVVSMVYIMYSIIERVFEKIKIKKKTLKYEGIYIFFGPCIEKLIWTTSAVKINQYKWNFSNNGRQMAQKLFSLIEKTSFLKNNPLFFWKLSIDHFVFPFFFKKLFKNILKTSRYFE